MRKNIMKTISEFFKTVAMKQALKEQSADKNAIDEEYEQCVLCGAMTETLATTPVEFRTNYEVGCGQLCVACYAKLKQEVTEEEELSPEQILFAVVQSQPEDK